MTSIVRLLKFLLISFVYWASGTVFIFITILPCGMGPEADCDMPGSFAIWSAIVGVVLVYVAICLFLVRRWIAK